MVLLHHLGCKSRPQIHRKLTVKTSQLIVPIILLSICLLVFLCSLRQWLPWQAIPSLWSTTVATAFPSISTAHTVQFYTWVSELCANDAGTEINFPRAPQSRAQPGTIGAGPASMSELNGLCPVIPLWQLWKSRYSWIRAALTITILVTSKGIQLLNR